jgi:MinD-like ATPase involved in chromosome partitioning or flagellar assembly
VGKSTTAVNLAATFSAQYGLRTLVIDMDGQCNATAALMGMDWQPEHTIKDVLWDPRAISEVMVPTRHDERLLIVAGSPELSYFEKSIEPHVWDDIVQEARATLLNGCRTTSTSSSSTRRPPSGSGSTRRSAPATRRSSSAGRTASA